MNDERSSSAEKIPPIIKRESSKEISRFLGIPRQDQIIEKSSIHGILNGRNVEDVIEQDTNELEQAGISWDDAINTLKFLSLLTAYLEANNFPKRKPIDFPGLNEVVIQRTDNQFLFDNPVSDMPDISESDSEDTIANQSGELTLRFSMDGEYVSYSHNPQTLYQAERHHLLEKGNRYSLTGAQLAWLHQKLDIPAMRIIINEWLEKEITENRLALKVQDNHQEIITFADETQVRFSVRKSIDREPKKSAIYIYLLDSSHLEEIKLCGVLSDSAALEFVTVMKVGDRDSSTTITKESNKLVKSYYSKNDLEEYTLEINPDELYEQYYELVTNIVESSRLQNDKILDTSIPELYKLAQLPVPEHEY